MKKSIIYSLAVLLLAVQALDASGQARRRADRDTDLFRYEIEAVSTGVQGTYQVKVWSYSKKEHVAVEQAMKNAVHGIVFKGFAGKQGVPGQRPLVSDPAVESTQSAFFEEFFDDRGDFQRFVSVAGNGQIAPGDRLKVGKKQYKIGVVVSVQSAALRKYLEERGIVKSLGSGF